MTRNVYALIAAAVMAVVGSACSSSDTGTESAGATSATSSNTEASTTTSAAATSDATAASSQLPSLIPTPANSQTTKGPDSIADNGIHLYFQVNGAPTDVMNAYKTALEGKGWALTTVASSDGGGGGGSIYTGTQGDAYGVFDGGGYQTSTFIDVCAWPSKPANPNCARGDR